MSVSAIKSWSVSVLDLYVKGYLDSQKNSMLAPEEVANESISFFVSVLNSMVFKNYQSMCFKVSKMLKDKIKG